MKASSVDLREQVLRAVDQGYPRSEIIQLFGVSRATIKRYLKRRRETGDVSVKPIPGGSRCHLSDALPDVGARARWVVPSDGWAGREKKTMGATERNEEARAAWREQCKQFDARQLVVIDECGSNIGLTPLYARAPQGQRAYGRVPRNRGKNSTLIASLTCDGMGDSMLIEGSANAAAFERSVEEILAPSLTAGQVVIMDNVAAHKGKKVEQLIQAKGCQLLFLPAYSPDFSPLKKPFPNCRPLYVEQELAHAKRCRKPSARHYSR